MKAYVLWPLCAIVPAALFWMPMCAAIGCKQIAWAVWLTVIGTLAVGSLVGGIIFERSRWSK
jgi:hypothetical protein